MKSFSEVERKLGSDRQCRPDEGPVLAPTNTVKGGKSASNHRAGGLINGRGDNDGRINRK
jgi:hypothetical protein